MKKLHLICNAHLDPVWLWEWEEGAAAAVSTFRSAANLLDKYDFIFNHNEANLYEWIREYEPQLFVRIQRLIREGKWHIMGGWYLQPDCNLPSGESLVRQIMRGRSYFEENFASRPTTAVNVDPFGHSSGLPQILKKCGFDSYLFCRPYPEQLKLEDDRFVWKGPDGSSVRCFRASDGYLSCLGEALPKIKRYIQSHQQESAGMLLWGIGNHGGGPSEQDLLEIADFAAKNEIEIIHSTPERYFEEDWESDSVRTGPLYPSMVGCYTSMALLKQKHRALENLLFSTEKLCSLAEMTQPDFVWPETELTEAENALLFAQFHDILPGSAIRAGGEAEGLRLLEHGYEMASKARARAFFAATSGFDPVKEESYPLFVFNPHPYPVEQDLSCEFMLQNQNWSGDFTFFTVEQEGKILPSQIIQETSALNIDWRKNLLFHATLPPFTISRFECHPYRTEKKPTYPELSENFAFTSPFYSVLVNIKTGLVDSLQSEGTEYLRPGAFLPVLIEDTPDPWGMAPAQLEKLGPSADSFTLMPPEQNASFCGTEKALPSVRLVEDGEVASIVEASMTCRHSSLLQTYIFYKHSPYFDLKVKTFFAEKDKAIKLKIPTRLSGSAWADSVFCSEESFPDGKEHPMQKWLALNDGEHTLALLNDGVYGFSCEKETLLPTLLRSPAYAAHPIEGRDLLRQDRFTDRMDQGEREFHFRICFGRSNKLFPLLSNLSASMNEKPFILNLYPSGSGRKLFPLLEISDPAIVMSCCKKSKEGHLIRLQHNGPGNREVWIQTSNKKANFCFGPFEVKTLRLETLEERTEMEI